MTVTPLERLLIDTCIDVQILRNTQRNLSGALAEVGVSGTAHELVASRRGHAISTVVRATRPQPSAQEIQDYAHARMADDPIFAMRMRDEPRPTLERAFLVRFPASRSVESFTADDGTLRITVIDRTVAGETTMDSSDPGDIDVDIDFPNSDIDLDIDDVVDIDDNDTDIDTDIDIELVVPTESAQGVNPRSQARWDLYWGQRAALWADLQSQSAK